MDNVKVISVEKKRKNYLVTTNQDDYKFSEDIIVKFCIFNDTEFTKEEWDKILIESSKTDGFNMALRYLAYGARSRSEMAKYLKDKDVTSIKEILDRLENLGYINDLELVDYFIAYYKEMKKGPNYIKEKLSLKMVPDELIATLKDKYDKSEEKEIVKVILEKEKENYKSYPIKKQREKMYTSLYAKGFSSDVITEMIDKVDFIDESSMRLEKDLKELTLKAEKKGLEKYDKKEYIISHLLSKGYEYSKIKNVLE